MNPKIVVDHELFTTCRLCLEEKGRYQIVPAIQKNIKFVYDIEVELNNGLPQLICVECEKLLSNFVCTKQLFQEKQKRLQKRLLCDNGTPNLGSTKQAKPLKKEKINSEHSSNEEDSEVEPENVVSDIVSSCGKQTKLIIKKTKKTHNKSWRSLFVKQFGCRLCSEKFKKKDEIETHIREHGRNITNTCFVSLEKYDNKPNITGSSKFVALHNNKIMRNKKYYYIVYSHKSNSYSDSSEDDVYTPKRKVKRRRLVSESSVDTVLIDESDPDIKAEMKMQSSIGENISQNLHVNNGQNSVIDSLITVCYNNLLKKRESTKIASKNAAEKSQLRHKILSIGSKIINTNPINCVGILRYLEYRHLEVNFTPNGSSENNYVRIRTKLRCKKEKNIDSTSNWKTLQDTAICIPTFDFFDVLNEALNSETVAKDKTSTPTHTAPSILLNAYPVPNPKKLPKKNEESSLVLQKLLETDNPLPENHIINTTDKNTSCTTNGVKDTTKTDSNTTTQNALPRLKLKPVHELMAPENRGRSQDCQFISQPFHCYAGSVHTSRAAPATGAPQLFVTSYNPDKGPAPTKYIAIAPTPTIIQPLAQIGNTMSNGTVDFNLVRQPEYIIMHTVEFPNTTTPSPFTYLKNLLQVNNIILMDSKANLTGDFRCLIKFKLCFRQEDGPHVELCLALYSNVTNFCIKVTDHQGIDIDITKMSANWQWELLKAFTGQIVPRLVANARNISLPMYEVVQKFICHLKSIQIIH